MLVHPGLENQTYGRRDLLRWPYDTLYPQKLALTLLKSGGHLVGIVRLQTKPTELFSLFVMLVQLSCEWDKF
jgi:hypothetical protein